MPKFSIIVPVYNASRHLDRTIEAVLSQSCRDFELILIDDGSEDNSLLICNQYADFDKRINVITKLNSGVSSTRNVGLNEAKGEWICFIDSDDEMLPFAIEAYLHAIQDDVDVIRAGFERIKNKKKTIVKTQGFITGNKEKVITTCNKTRYEAYLWNSCFRRKAIAEIKFDDSISFCEDHLFTYSVMARARNVSFISDVVYRYYAPSSSAITANGNLSSRYLEPSMIMRGALAEKNVKFSCVSDTAQYAKLIIIEEFKWKVRLAIKYAVIGNHYFEAISITHKHLNNSFGHLFSNILHIKIVPIIRKISK